MRIRKVICADNFWHCWFFCFLAIQLQLPKALRCSKTANALTQLWSAQRPVPLKNGPPQKAMGSDPYYL